MGRCTLSCWGQHGHKQECPRPKRRDSRSFVWLIHRRVSSQQNLSLSLGSTQVAADGLTETAYDPQSRPRVSGTIPWAEPSERHISIRELRRGCLVMPCRGSTLAT